MPKFFYRGHILIFLTGQEEIELLANLLKDCLSGKIQRLLVGLVDF
jgi:HrpA-like RNA helicase